MKQTSKKSGVFKVYNNRGDRVFKGKCYFIEDSGPTESCPTYDFTGLDADGKVVFSVKILSRDFSHSEFVC